MSISVSSSAGFNSVQAMMHRHHATRPGFQPPGFQPQTMEGTTPDKAHPFTQPPGQQLSAALHDQLMRLRTELAR